MDEPSKPRITQILTGRLRKMAVLDSDAVGQHFVTLNGVELGELISDQYNDEQVEIRITKARADDE